MADLHGEAGGERATGSLGAGAGKWRLRVTADAPPAVMSLLESPTSHLSNVSTAPTRVELNQLRLGCGGGEASRGRIVRPRSSPGPKKPVAIVVDHVFRSVGHPYLGLPSDGIDVLSEFGEVRESGDEDQPALRVLR